MTFSLGKRLMLSPIDPKSVGVMILDNSLTYIIVQQSLKYVHHVDYIHSLKLRYRRSKNFNIHLRPTGPGRGSETSAQGVG
jgi:hypothetical protein